MFVQNSAYSAPHPHRSACPPHQQESLALVERPSLAYNPAETHAELRDRQRRAYEAGRQAWQERRMPAYLIPFYESLVERVGANKYTWVSEETLAKAFQVDVSTIKRWIARLVRSGLIRRQRQYGTSSRTYITAYDPTTVLLTGEANPTTATDALVTTEKEQHSDDQTSTHTAIQEEQDILTEEVSFRCTDEPSFGSDLSRDLKTDHLNPGGGGKTYSNRSHRSAALEISRILEREGVNQFYIAPRLRQQPIADLKAISGYLDTQHNVRDRARLFAALACRNFGAQLLAGRKRQEPRHGTKRGNSAPADDHLKYVSGSLAPYLLAGSVTPAESAPVAPVVAHSDPPRADESAIDRAQVWQQVRDSLQHALPPSEFTTWFDQAVLIDLDRTRAVIGTPNIFVREKVEGDYQGFLTAAFRTLYGPDVMVQVVIGG